MKVIPFIYEDIDDLFANTYVLIDNSDCVVIDPGRDYRGIVDYINKNQLSLKAVLLTHGHFDHMRGVNILLEEFDSPLYIGFFDEDRLTDSYKNLSGLFSNEEVVISRKAITISDNETILLLNEPIKVIETPFHTKGSVCYYLKDSGFLFSGDTLFKGSIGRDDLPGAEPSKKKSSLAKLMTLPDNTKVFPGHGGSSTIGDEKKYNPFVK